MNEEERKKELDQAFGQGCMIGILIGLVVAILIAVVEVWKATP